MADESIQLSPSLTLQTYHDGRILVFRLMGTEREMVDLWANEALARLNAIAAPNLPLILHDLSDPKFNFTPYLQNKAQEIADRAGNRPVKVAITLPSASLMRGLLLQLLQNFRRTVLGQKSELTIQFFNTREDGLKWLETFL